MKHRDRMPYTRLRQALLDERQAQPDGDTQHLPLMRAASGSIDGGGEIDSFSRRCYSALKSVSSRNPWSTGIERKIARSRSRSPAF